MEYVPYGRDVSVSLRRLAAACGRDTATKWSTDCQLIHLHLLQDLNFYLLERARSTSGRHTSGRTLTSISNTPNRAYSSLNFENTSRAGRPYVGYATTPSFVSMCIPGNARGRRAPKGSVTKGMRTHPGLGLIARDFVDSREDLGRELGDDLERLEVLEQLLGLRGPKDDGRRVRVARDPRERELGHSTAELCVGWVRRRSQPNSGVRRDTGIWNEPFSASSVSLRTMLICFWPSSDLRNSILRLNIGSCSTWRREPSGMPSLY